MKRIISFAVALLVASTLVRAHGVNEHVRGVVTEVTPKTITVKVDEKTTKSLTITSKTTVQQNGKTVTLADVKVGNRVVIDVPEKTSDALLVQIGAASQVK